MQGSPIWTVRLVVSGGFAGLSHEIVVDSVTGKAIVTNQKTDQRDEQTLSDPDRIQIAQLIHALPPEILTDTSSDCNDCFSYDVHVSRDGVVQNARLESLTLADSAYAPLIAKLLAIKSSAETVRP
jgi:hypothetical protein